METSRHDEDVSPGYDDELSVHQQFESELAELRAANARLAGDIERLSASAGSHRWRRRRGRATVEDSRAVSRRRIFGLLGEAVAAGAGLAVAGSALAPGTAGATAVTAGAADGDAFMIGGSNSCLSGTALTSVAADTTTLVGISNATNGRGVGGECDSGSGAIGVFGTSTTGYGLVGRAPGGLAPLQLAPSTSAGAPAAGTHLAGEFVVDSNGVLFTCAVAGSPGTWVRQAPLVTLAAPSRVYDSRAGKPNPSGSAQGALVFGAAARTINCSPAVPAGASAILFNLTVTGTAGSLAGALLVWAVGVSQPSASSINWSGSGTTLANSVTSACDASQDVQVRCVASAGSSTNFILDVIGYYR